MTQKHTPGPWELHRMYFNRAIPLPDEKDCRISGPGDDKQVAILTHNFGLSADEMMANARFIVQACNAHEELLSLLQRAVPWMKVVSSNDMGGYSDNDPTLYEEILAAIARATSPQAR